MKRAMNRLRVYFLFLLVLALYGCAIGRGGVPLEDLRAKANQGDPAAQFQLGVAYDEGRGVAKDQREAVAWYRKSSEQDYAAAQNSLGSMYQYGEGVLQDNSEAVRWYQKAADQGYGEGYTNLGYMYDTGLGVKQDKTKAIILYQRGADTGSLNAMLNLGVCYWKGDGLSTDFVQAYKWLDLARYYTQRSSNMRLKWQVREVLGQVKKEMTAEQISAAERLAKEWASEKTTLR